MANPHHKALQRHLLRGGTWPHIRDLLFITVISFAIGFFFSGGDNVKYDVGWNILYSFVLGGSLWKGSEFISVYIYSRINMMEEPRKLVIYNGVAVTSWIILDIVLVNYWWFILHLDYSIQEFFASGIVWLNLIVDFTVAMFINLIFFAINFYKSWNFLNKHKRELEHDKMALEFQTLRDQVNPHFLFNSLNTLSALVDIDKDKAQIFITELSKVYRYVLDTQKDETIPMQEEMQFVDSFVYLNKLRLGDNLQFQNHLDANGFKVIPLSVQMLIENAIKHNIASSQQPLQIDILKDGNCILVQNTWQPKENINEEKVSKNSRLGLENLKFRYQFITDKEVRIAQEEGLFKVYLPLID